MGGDMRLRNKKTGETRVFYYLHPALPNGSVILGLLDDDGESQTHTYGSLADFNEEWEDYEPAEPLIKDEETIDEKPMVKHKYELHVICPYCEKECDVPICVTTDDKDINDVISLLCSFGVRGRKKEEEA